MKLVKDIRAYLTFSAMDFLLGQNFWILRIHHHIFSSTSMSWRDTGLHPLTETVCEVCSICIMNLGTSIHMVSPFICFLLFLPVSIPWAEVDEWWICVVHYLACLSPTVCSVFYHLFMNHEGGAPIYDTLLCFDMVGVCLVNTLGALPIIYITLLCYPSSRRVAMLAYLLLSGYGVHCAVTAQSNVHRLQSFAWQAFFRFILFILRLTGTGRGSPASLRLYLTMDALALLGGLINVSRLPERFSPGRFDYWLNSHQIMHIMVILSILYLHWGMLEDLTWLKVHHCPGE